MKKRESKLSFLFSQKSKQNFGIAKYLILCYNYVRGGKDALN